MSGPVFAHGQLRLYLLALLEAAPRNGYDLIKGLSDQFGGTYRPSPGTVYPRLARLEEEGLIEKVDHGRKAAYRITDAGIAELDARREELVATEGEIAMTVRERADQLRRETLADATQLKTSLASSATAMRLDKSKSARRAAAAQDAGVDLGGQIQARAAMRDAETLLTLFRAEARAELRLQAARGTLTHERVGALRATLDEALASLKS